MNLAQREALYGPVVRRAFETEGLPSFWGMALARHESAFVPGAAATIGGDARRGGSFGLCQMSLSTAKSELGYVGDGEGLKDPQLNCTLAARYIKILMARFKIDDLPNVAAAYNSGRPLAKAPSGTRTKYVPLVLNYAKQYQTQQEMTSCK